MGRGLVCSKSSNVFFCQNFVSLNKQFSKMGKECNQICVFAYVFPMQHFAWLRTAGHRESRGFWIALAPVWVPVRAPVSVPAGDAAPGSAVPICAQHFCFLGWYPGSSCPLGVCHRTMRLRHCAEVLTCVCVFISR